MTSNKGTARLAGVLFLLATASFMTGSGLVDSVLNQPSFLSHLYPDRMKVLAGLFLELINSASVVGISILMFPILKQYSVSIALGYFGTRIIESALLIVSITGPLTLLVLSKDFIAEGGAGDSYFQTIGHMVIRGHDMVFELAMLVLSLGSVMFCSLLYRTKLIPQTMSFLGVIGYLSLLASSCLTIIGFDPGSILYLPGGLFEIIFPLWLIIGGFYTTK